MEALIVYYSKNGTTRKFAEAIAYQVKKRVDHIKIKSIEEVSLQDVIHCDLLYLGCQTSDMFVFNQKLGKPWVDFVSKLPDLESKTTVLFTTYRLTTGSMFRKMKEILAPKGFDVIGCMKSRNGNFDYFSNGVLRYSLYNLVSSQISNHNVFESSRELVMEPA